MSSRIGNIKILSCGYCKQLERLATKKGSWKFVHFYARCYLIPLKDGFLLFDSGYSADVNNIMKYWPAYLYKKLIPITIPKNKTAISQLADLGISAKEVKYIFISHFHADHIGGLKDFHNAKFICSKEGYESLKKLSKLRQVCKGFISELLPDNFEKRIVFINKEQSKKISGLTFYPLINLPNMYAVDLPGHAKGQLGLFIENESILLAADAAWQRSNFKKGGEPSSLALLFGESKINYLHTLSKLANLPDIKILFTHEEE